MRAGSTIALRVFAPVAALTLLIKTVPRKTASAPSYWQMRVSNLRTVAAPVLIAHSLEDDIIPFEHGRALFAAANSPKQFLELAGGHNNGFIFMREAWIKLLGDFIGEQMDAACIR